MLGASSWTANAIALDNQHSELRCNEKHGMRWEPADMKVKELLH